MASMDFLCNSISITLLALLLTLFSIKVLTSKLQGNDKKEKKYHPIAGTVFHQLLNFNRLHHYMTDLAGKHRTYRLLSPFRSEIYTADPANVEYMLKTNFDNYGKGSHNYVILKDLLGDGIFTVDGDKWRQQRKVSSYEFSTKVLRDFSSVVFRKNVAKLASIVSEAATTNQTFDIQDLFMKSTLDSIFKVAFGVELDSMCGSSEEGINFSNAFDDSSVMTVWRYVDLSWKIKKLLNIGSEAVLKKNIQVVNNFVYKLIDSKTKQIQNSKDDSSWKKEDILSRFLQLTETDPKYLRDIILNFIIAGKDTTGTALSWFIYMLCKHPDIQEKVAKEVKEATNMTEIVDFVEFAASVNEEALEKMPYLHAALTETLRLYPAVPVDAKICFSDDTLPDGFCVRKGDMVSYQPYAMGRMTFIWGNDAEDFKPERWIDGDGLFRPESPFKFTAFQGLLMKCTLDSIFKVGFGVELNCLEGSSKESSAFGKAFDDSNALIYWRYVDPLWKLKRFFNIGSEATIRKNIKVIDEFVYELIRTKKKQLHLQQDNNEKEDILSRFLVEREKDEEKMNDQYMRDVIFNFMIAGRDSTAVTLSWFFYMLCKHPLVQEKIVQEIREVLINDIVGDDIACDENFVTQINDAALEKMQYLHAALSETLRLYPAVPVDGMCAETDDVLPDGYRVKKGDGVYYMAYAMGRMPHIWGDDAEDFRPERWLNNGNFQPESPFKFVAFHAGPRICLGKDFAYRQMKIVAMALISFFRFTLADDTKNVTYRTMFTLHIKGGLNLNAIPRTRSVR